MRPGSGFLLTLIGFASVVVTTTPMRAHAVEGELLDRWLRGQYLIVFPRPVQEAFYKTIDEVQLNRESNSPECVSVHSAWPWKKVLRVNVNCVQESDLVQDLGTTQFHRDLFQTVVKVWIKHKELDSEHMASKIAIWNYFFETGAPSFKPRVNLDQSLNRSLDDFWVKVIWKAVDDLPGLREQNPLLFNFISEYIYEDGTHFKTDVADRFWNFSEGRVRYTKSNTESWYARYFLIQQAKYKIHAQYFILESDIFGLSFLEMLRRKALEGVKVKLMVDVRGTLAMATRPWEMAYLAALADAGVEVRLYNSWLFGGSSESPFVANHDKILLVDERDFIVGGRNISKDYLLEPEDHPRVFEDADVIARSDTEAVRLLVAFNEEFYGGKNSVIRKNTSFATTATVERLKNSLPAIEEWMFTANTSSELIDQYPELKSYAHLKGYNFGDLLGGESSYDAKMKVVDSTSKFQQRNDIIDALFFMMETAQKRILIHTPYLVLTERLRETLTRASQRGVEIKITTNSRESTDNPFPVTVFEGEWRGIYRDMPTLQLYTVKGPARLHQKIFVFDDEHSIVSSYNFDTMSEKRNSEVGLYVNSRSFNREVALWMDSYTNKKAILLPLPASDERDVRGVMYWILNLFRRYL